MQAGSDWPRWAKHQQLWGQDYRRAEGQSPCPGEQASVQT